MSTETLLARLLRILPDLLLAIASPHDHGAVFAPALVRVRVREREVAR